MRVLAVGKLCLALGVYKPPDKIGASGSLGANQFSFPSVIFAYHILGKFQLPSALPWFLSGEPKRIDLSLEAVKVLEYHHNQLSKVGFFDGFQGNH